MVRHFKICTIAFLSLFLLFLAVDRKSNIWKESAATAVRFTGQKQNAVCLAIFEAPRNALLAANQISIPALPKQYLPTPTPFDVPPVVVSVHALPHPTPFSIVWLSDMQTMTYMQFPERLQKMGEWIAKERDEKNIKFVVQTGDAVENGFNPKQWAQFDICYLAFKDFVPYFAIAGNHELSIKRKDFAAFLMREYIKEIPRFNAFERGRAAFATFSAGGKDFIILGAGWSSEEEAAPWMNEILHRYPNRIAILLFHSYIQPQNRFTKEGKRMFDLVVKPNPNVRFVLCGHVPGTAYRVDEIDDNGDGVPDRRVHAFMYNYQNEKLNTGQLRLLTFDPEAHTLTVLTYSPPLQRYFRDGVFSRAEFTVDNAF